MVGCLPVPVADRSLAFRETVRIASIKLESLQFSNHSMSPIIAMKVEATSSAFCHCGCSPRGGTVSATRQWQAVDEKKTLKGECVNLPCLRVFSAPKNLPDTVDGSEILLTGWHGRYLTLFTGFPYIPGGFLAGFLKHQTVSHPEKHDISNPPIKFDRLFWGNWRVQKTLVISRWKFL